LFQLVATLAIGLKAAGLHGPADGPAGEDYEDADDVVSNDLCHSEQVGAPVRAHLFTFAYFAVGNSFAAGCPGGNLPSKIMVGTK